MMRGRMKYEMPKLTYQELVLKIHKHSHLLKKLCPDMTGINMEKTIMPLGDGLHMEIEPYFFADFHPYAGNMIITSTEQIEKKLSEFFTHVFACDKC